MRITTGSDPEFFLTDEEGKIVSCHTADVQGTKDSPHPMSFGHVHRDNVLMELNVPESTSEEEWITNHLRCMQEAQSEISDKYKVSPVSSFVMSEDELWHPEAMISGCDADFNAWLDGAKNPAANLSSTDLRTAGAHIHVGYTHPSKHFSIRIVKCMDIFLGVPSLLMDEDVRRRELYGKAGSFRPKPYGVEYRTLSNFWTHTPELLGWAFRNTQRAVNFAESEPSLDRFRGVEGIINNNDLDAAKALVKDLKLEVV